MLNKNRRLSSSLLQNVFKAGKSIFGQDISLVYLEHKESVPTRFSFSVSSKAVKTAVARNAIRRIGYTVLEKKLALVRPSFDAVFVVKKSLPYKTYDFESTLSFLLAKARIL